MDAARRETTTRLIAVGHLRQVDHRRTNRGYHRKIPSDLKDVRSDRNRWRCPAKSIDIEYQRTHV